MTLFAPNELIIDDSNYLQHVDVNVVEGKLFGKGYVERDYSLFPVGSIRGIEAFSIPLIPRNEWSSRIKDFNLFIFCSNVKSI